MLLLPQLHIVHCHKPLVNSVPFAGMQVGEGTWGR